MGDRISIKKQIATYMDECVALDGVSGCAVVSRTGVLMGKKIDQDFSVPSFAAMSATVLGSAEAAAGMMHFSQPSSIFVEVDDGGIIIRAIGKGELIAVIINKSADIKFLKRELAIITNKIWEK